MFLPIQSKAILLHDMDDIPESSVNSFLWSDPVGMQVPPYSRAQYLKLKLNQDFDIQDKTLKTTFMFLPESSFQIPVGITTRERNRRTVQNNR